MGIEDRKEREREKLKSKILLEAERIIATKGLENLSMRKIASRIEYSPTTIYRYFKDKDSLLTAIVHRNQHEITERFRIILKDDDITDPLEKLKSLIKAYIIFCLEFEDTYTLYSKLSRYEITDNKIYETIGGERHCIFSSWQDQIDILLSEGRIQSSRSVDIILLIWHVTHGYISNRISLESILWKETEEEIDNIISLIFNGLLINKSQS